MGIAFEAVGPYLSLGLVVLLALKAAKMMLPKPYHQFWKYAWPWVSSPHLCGENFETSAFYIVIPLAQALAFVMWVANKFLFWPYLARWVLEMLVMLWDERFRAEIADLREGFCLCARLVGFWVQAVHVCLAGVDRSVQHTMDSWIYLDWAWGFEGRAPPPSRWWTFSSLLSQV